MVLAIPKDRAFSDPSDCDKVLDQRGYGCGPKYLIESIVRIDQDTCPALRSDEERLLVDFTSITAIYYRLTHNPIEKGIELNGIRIFKLHGHAWLIGLAGVSQSDQQLSRGVALHRGQIALFTALRCHFYLANSSYIHLIFIHIF